LHDFDVNAEEMSRILSAGGPKVTAEDVERWVTQELPGDDKQSELFRRWLCGFVIVNDIRPIVRRVPAGHPSLAEEPVAAPAEPGEPANLSEALESVEAVEAVAR
jgi:hypothetical protein